MAEKCSTPTSSCTLTAEQKRISKRIRKLSRRVIRLKTRYNELAPINRLPPELLIRTFLALQLNLHEVFAKQYYKWMSVAQVSQSWRAIAFGAKQLWNGISQNETASASTSMAALLEGFFKRSSPLKLEVVVDINLDVDQDVDLAPLKTQNYRIHTLEVSIFETQMESDSRRYSKLNQLIRWLGMGMPALEELRLYGHSDDNSEPDDPLFPHPNPTLRSLEVSNFNLPLGSLPFSGLTNLTVRHEQGHSGTLSFPVLFNLLLVARLHTLNLQHALSDDSEDDSLNHITLIPLPSLSSLTLVLPAPQCVKLLRRLTVNSSCRAKVWGQSIGHDGLVINAQEFFDQVFLCTSLDATQFSVLSFKIEDDFVSMDLASQKHAGVEIRFAFSGNHDGNWLSFPSLSSFSEVWRVTLTGSPQRNTHSAIKGLISMLSNLPSLQNLAFSVHFLSVFSNHLYNDPRSFEELIKIKVFSIQESTTLEELERGLDRHTDIYNGDAITVTLLGSPGWSKLGAFVGVLDRLKELCHLSLLNTVIN